MANVDHRRSSCLRIELGPSTVGLVLSYTLACSCLGRAGYTPVHHGAFALLLHSQQSERVRFTFCSMTPALSTARVSHPTKLNFNKKHILKTPHHRKQPATKQRSPTAVAHTVQRVGPCTVAHATNSDGTQFTPRRCHRAHVELLAIALSQPNPYGKQQFRIKCEQAPVSSHAQSARYPRQRCP